MRIAVFRGILVDCAESERYTGRPMVLRLMRLVTGLMLMGSILLSSASGMVLCVGEDGHFVVETANHDHGGCPQDADDCTHQDAGPSGEDAGWHSPDGCDDIRLDLQIASLVTKLLQGKRLLKSGSISPMLAGHDAVLALNVAYGRKNPRDTVILRISPFILEKRITVLRI
jgi:hypothetical protein